MASLSIALSLLLTQASVARTLVMPFENLSPQQADSWLGEAFAEATIANLSAVGEAVVGLAERNRRLADMGLPLNAPITRASMILLGQGLGADRAVVGSFRVEEERVAVTAKVLDLEKGTIVGVIEDMGQLTDLMELQNQVAKNLLRLEGDPVPDYYQQAASRRKTIPLAAYTSYVKALVGENVEKQMELLQTALERYPAYSEASLLLGQVLLRAGEARRAIEILSSIRREDPLYREAYFTNGLAYLAAGEPAGAAQIFSHLAEQEGVAAFFNNQGVALLRSGQLQQALQAFIRAVEGEPREADLFFNLGWCAWQAGKGAEAVKWLREATRRNPADGEAHFLLSAAASSQTLKEEAEQERKLALELSSRFEQLDASTIKGLERVIERPPAIGPAQAVEAAGEQSLSDLVRDQIERARSLRASGKPEEGIRELQRAVYLSPYSANARLELARLFCEVGELEKAAGEVKIVLWDTESSDAYLLLAEVYEAMGEPGQARAHAEKAAALDPDNPDVVKFLDRLKGGAP